MDKMAYDGLGQNCMVSSEAQHKPAFNTPNVNNEITNSSEETAVPLCVLSTLPITLRETKK